jgi:lysophospholipase L1-like esterase
VPAECEWWGTSTARVEIDRFKPDVVFVMGGLGDLWDRKLPEWPDYRSPGDPLFDSFIVREYQALADVAGANGVPVVWAVPPCMDPARFDRWTTREEGQRRFEHHNGTYIPAVRVAKQVTLADVNAQLCPNGEFDRNALGIQNSRPDGLHLTDQAAEELARRWLGPLLVSAAK